MSRFSQAISEGDGISVIPVLEGNVAELAELARGAGAEALAVAAADVGRVRGTSALPIIARHLGPREASEAGADACILVYETLAEEAGRLEDAYALARELDLDCAVEVRDEDELEGVLERIDPDLVLISEREIEPDEEDLERTLDLLADVPVGKLVISEARIVAREQIVALERAGVDGVLVQGLVQGAGFAAALEELVRGSGTHH
jgi:indole-3-glycerol phosphate synthase